MNVSFAQSSVKLTRFIHVERLQLRLIDNSAENNQCGKYTVLY